MVALPLHLSENEAEIWRLLEEVKDPEIPVLSVVDLGIVRQVKCSDIEVEVLITPTYSGCPAMNTIEVDILEALRAEGYSGPKVTTVLSPAWTTDWLSEAGKDKLLRFGIAPPRGGAPSKRALFVDRGPIQCPRCQSERTERVSEFGSTACKALYRCIDCREPFDYFKCI